VVHGSIGNTFLGGSNVYGLGFSGTHTFGVGPCVGFLVGSTGLRVGLRVGSVVGAGGRGSVVGAGGGLGALDDDPVLHLLDLLPFPVFDLLLLLFELLDLPPFALDALEED